MIGGLKPYSKMKDSGVPWLAEVPEHWDVQRLRNLADMRVSNVDKHTKDDEQPVRLCNYVDVYKNDYIRPSMSLMRATATKEEIERFRLAEGDVLITKDSEAWNDIGVPALIRESADDLVSGYHLALLRPLRRRIAGEFLFRSLQSVGLQYQFHVEANGVTRYGLSHAAIKSVWLPAPPVSEQAAIVRFLDHADRRIRRHIRAKQKLIKLLEEQKLAIIHRAVTRGLDPNVRLKPSGVEWLGDVPEHWEALLLGRCLNRIEQGWSPVAAEGALETDQWAVLSLSSVKRGIFDPTAIKPIPTSAKVPKGIEVANGDLLLTRSNTRELVGDVCVASGVREKTVLCDLIYRLTPDLRFDSRFLMFHLLCPIGRAQIERDARGSSGTMPKIAQRHIRSWRVLVPPLHEQRAIVRAIEAQLRVGDEAVSRARREIDLLREYRTRLIADVVTGKLDVREAAARLPQETEDLEPLDEAEVEGEAEENEAGDGVPEETEA